MNAMIEVFYGRPRDLERERKISEVAAVHAGHLDCFEETNLPGISDTVSLTFVFAARVQAERAKAALEAIGYHVEDCGDYPE
jgi:hypothetical protein